MYFNLDYICQSATLTEVRICRWKGRVCAHGKFFRKLLRLGKTANTNICSDAPENFPHVIEKIIHVFFLYKIPFTFYSPLIISIIIIYLFKFFCKINQLRYRFLYIIRYKSFINYSYLFLCIRYRSYCVRFVHRKITKKVVVVKSIVWTKKLKDVDFCNFHLQDVLIVGQKNECKYRL
jgi:hypothetical protein